MPDSIPSVRSNSLSAPAPIKANFQGATPAPMGGISPVPAQQPPSLAPTSNLAAPVAPAPVVRVEVAIAPTSISTPPVAPVALVAEAIVAPAPRQKIPSESVVPPLYQNLCYFENWQEVRAAITRVKARAGQVERKFAWSRVDSEPVIAQPSFDELITAVFGSDNSDFKVDDRLNKVIAKLPTEVAQAARDLKSSLQLEGLWIQFPETANLSLKPKLAIAVSIAISESATNMGPFTANRVHLTFGDFQP